MMFSILTVVFVHFNHFFKWNKHFTGKKNGSAPSHRPPRRSQASTAARDRAGTSMDCSAWPI